MECQLNHAEHTTTAGLTGVFDPEAHCVCKQGYFTNPDKGADMSQRCLPCPQGALCDKDNMRLSDLVALPGFWRPDLKHRVFFSCSQGLKSIDRDEVAKERCCPKGLCGRDLLRNVSNSTAANSTDSFDAFTSDVQCAEMYSGPLCLNCLPNHVRRGEVCAPCEGGSNIGAAFTATMLLSVPIFIGVLAFLLCATNDAKKISSITTTVRPYRTEM